jgi:hypothetical protein
LILLALDYDGSDDYVTYSGVLGSLARPCIMFGWVYRDTTANNMVLIANRTGNAANVGWGMETKTTSASDVGFVKYGAVEIASGLTITNATWTFCVCEIQPAGGNNNKVKCFHVTTDGTVTSALSSNTTAISTGTDSLRTGNCRGPAGAFADDYDGKYAWIAVMEGTPAAMTDNEILGLSKCPFRLFGYGRPDFFSPQEGSSTVENYGDQGGTGTITGTVTKFAGNPPIPHMSLFISGF